MIVQESRAKDVYRRVVWGPWREALERGPHGFEYVANRQLGLLAGRFSAGTRQKVEANLRRAFPVRSDLARVARTQAGGARGKLGLAGVNDAPVNRGEREPRVVVSSIIQSYLLLSSVI